jgi:hypothetical protein
VQLTKRTTASEFKEELEFESTVKPFTETVVLLVMSNAGTVKVADGEHFMIATSTPAPCNATLLLLATCIDDAIKYVPAGK